MNARNLVERALEQGEGVLRLAPNWVPRSFCVPGRRIKLHPDDYYALGGQRGGPSVNAGLRRVPRVVNLIELYTLCTRDDPTRFLERQGNITVETAGAKTDQW